MENYWKYSLALYLTVRVLFWFNNDNSVTWTVIWLLNEKQLPFVCLLSLKPCFNNNFVNVALINIGLYSMLFMAVYGVMYQCYEPARKITAVQVSGTFIAYCIIVLFFVALFSKHTKRKRLCKE